MGFGQRTGAWETGSPLSVEQKQLREPKVRKWLGREIVRTVASHGTDKAMRRQEG